MRDRYGVGFVEASLFSGEYLELDDTSSHVQVKIVTDNGDLGIMIPVDNAVALALCILGSSTPRVLDAIDRVER